MNWASRGLPSPATEYDGEMESSLSQLLHSVTKSGQFFFQRVAPAYLISFSSVLSFIPEVLTFLALSLHLPLPLHNNGSSFGFPVGPEFLFIGPKHYFTPPICYFLILPLQSGPEPVSACLLRLSGFPSVGISDLSLQCTPSPHSPTSSLLPAFLPFSKLPQHAGFVVLSLVHDLTH